MIVSVTVCVIVLLLFCRLWKWLNAKRTHSLGERRMSFNEDEYSFTVDDSQDILSQHEEEKRLIPA